MGVLGLIKKRLNEHIIFKHKEEGKAYLDMKKIEIEARPRNIHWYASGSLKKFEKGKGKNKLICPACGKDFSRTFIRNHIRYMHVDTQNLDLTNNPDAGNLPKFQCDQCDKAVCDLPRHIEQVHAGIKRYKCGLCTFRCRDVTTLNDTQK